jgi:hypothetical protein
MVLWLQCIKDSKHLIELKKDWLVYSRRSLYLSSSCLGNFPLFALILSSVMAELQEVCNRAIADIDEKNPRWFSQFSKMEFNVCLVGF